jgi:hypothetical protein
MLHYRILAEQIEEKRKQKEEEKEKDKLEEEKVIAAAKGKNISEQIEVGNCTTAKAIYLSVCTIHNTQYTINNKQNTIQ